MKTWEYKVIDSTDGNIPTAMLAILGRRGWEAWAMEGPTHLAPGRRVFLKRPIRIWKRILHLFARAL